MEFITLRRITHRLLATFVSFTCLVSANSFGKDPSDIGLRISTYVPAVCTATITAVNPRPDFNQIRIDIYELCNVGNGYELELLHDGIGINGMSYDNVDVPNSANKSTILATRLGAYHGRRVLLIETDDPIGPDIQGVRIRQFSTNNAQPKI